MTAKGQSSLEHLIITGIGLAFAVLVFSLSINFATDNLRSAQARNVVQKLANAADYVYSFGPGTKTEVQVEVPSGVQSITSSGNRIHLALSLSSGINDVFANTNATVNGALTTTEGTQTIKVKTTDINRVQFGDSPLNCSLTVLSKNFLPGETGNDSINITNVGTSVITGISAAVSGNINDLVSITQPSSSLNPLASSNISLYFNISSNKIPGVYYGTLLVNGSNNSECGTAITILVVQPGGVDTQGPLVTSIAHTPLLASTTDEIIINATGDDTFRGNNSIFSCQLELDNAGTWNTMTAADGAYNEPIELVTRNLGILNRGNHTVRVRCSDSLSNMGSPLSYNFNVTAKNILFILDSNLPSSEETRWFSWLNSHTSELGFNYSYDNASRTDAGSGIVNVSNYRIAMMADAPNVDSALYTTLNNYKSEGGYIVLLGAAIDRGMSNLNVATGNGGTTTRDQINITAAHYITNGFTIGAPVTVISSDSPIYYHTNFNGTNVASTEDSTSQGVIIDALNVLTFGSTRPDLFTANGSAIAVRVFDYALANAE